MICSERWANHDRRELRPQADQVMDSTTTTVLYALSTIAQTCAALAAFVGAVGLFRLQLLRIKQDTAERDLRGLASRAGLESSDLAALTPIGVIAQRVENEDPKRGGYIPAAREALKVWNASPYAFRPSRNALIWFEVWNLAVIGLTLIGFAFVPTLARFSRVSAVLLCLIAVGTVTITLWCVAVWTKEAVA